MPVRPLRSGEIITEAVGLRYGSAELSALSVAMGLTPVEADLAGISWK